MNATMPSLQAQSRVAAGKSAARRLRSSGQIPAVAYGKGLPSTPLAVSPKELLAILQGERGQNTVIKLGVGGASAKDILVMIRDFTYHPVTRSLEHVDFVEVKLDRPVDVEIPLIGTGKPAGLVQGGILRQVYRTLPVRCLPDRIPLKLELDVSPLKLGEHLSTKDLTLTQGVEVLLPPEQTLIAIVAPEKDRSEETPAAAAAGAAAAPGAAAPAAKTAAAKTPAAKAAAPAAKDAKKK